MRCGATPTPCPSRARAGSPACATASSASALALVHEKPAHDWTIDELGQRVGLSRSALHERFVQLLGVPPMQYLAQWRMQTAARLLLETRATVAAIALDVGYDSEAAFARAFKRVVGKPPAAWRRERGGDPE